MGATGKRITLPISAVVGIIALVVVAIGAAGAFTLARGGGSAAYEVDMSMSEPTRANRLLPEAVTCPTGGRFDGEPDAAPLPGASYAPTDKTLDANFAPGQVVAFQYAVRVGADAPPNGALDLELAFPKATSRQMGFDPDRNVICAFVDSSDPAYRGGDESAVAKAQVQDLPATPESIRTQLAVTGLDPNDRVVVELWVVTPRGIPETSPTLETTITSAEADKDAGVKLVRDTVAFRINFFDRSEQPVLTLDVNDTPPEGASRTDRVDYNLTVTNTSKEALAPAARLDTYLDSQLTLAAVTPADQEGAATTCVKSEKGFACDLGFVNPGEVVHITVQTALKPEAERRFTKEDRGCEGENVDVCSRMVLAWFRTAEAQDSITWEEPSDIPDTEPLSILKLAPKAPYAYPGSKVDFTYQVSDAGTGSYSRLLVTDTACTPVIYVSGDLNGNGTLDPKETWTYSCTVPAMTEETSRGDSRVEALTDVGIPVTDTVSTKITLIAPSLAVDVQALVNDPGSRSIVVTNTGDTPLTNLALAATGCAQPPTLDGAVSGEVLDTGSSWSYLCPAEPAQVVSIRAYAADPLENAVTMVATSTS